MVLFQSHTFRTTLIIPTNSPINHNNIHNVISAPLPTTHSPRPSMMDQNPHHINNRSNPDHPHHSLALSPSSLFHHHSILLTKSISATQIIIYHISHQNTIDVQTRTNQNTPFPPSIPIITFNRSICRQHYSTSRFTLHLRPSPPSISVLVQMSHVSTHTRIYNQTSQVFKEEKNGDDDESW